MDLGSADDLDDTHRVYPKGGEHDPWRTGVDAGLWDDFSISN